MQRKYFGARRGIQSQRSEIVGDTRERKSGDACYHIAQLLAPPTEARGDEFPERRNFLRLDERLRERRESHDRAAHLRRRPEGSGSYLKQLLHPTHRLHANRQRAVDLRTWVRRDAISDLRLNKKHDALGQWR